MKLLEIYQKITNIFNTSKRLALEEKALEYRMKKKYNNIPNSQIKIEIENLEAKRRFWKILNPLLGITTFTVIIGGILILFQQVGYYLIVRDHKGVGQFSASQVSLAKVYFIFFILFLISVLFLLLILLFNRDKKRVQTLNYLKEKLKNVENNNNCNSVNDSEER